MKLARCLAVTALVATSAMSPSRVSSSEPDVALWRATMTTTFAELASNDDPGCAVGVASGGALLASTAFGLANLEHGIPITESTAFDIGSVSKQFTAASIALLSLDGKLDLKADIRTILPDLPDYRDSVIVLNLIHHSSGIPDPYPGLEQLFGDEDGNFYPSEFTLRAIRRSKELNFKPGQRFEYSNAGYLVLGEIVEAVSGQSLAEYAQKNIFAPLQMNDTRFQDDYRRLVPHRADGYGRNADGAWENRTSNFYVVGDGGVFTTLSDFARWQGNFSDNQLASGNPGFTALMEKVGTYEEGNPTFDGREFEYAFGLMIWDVSGRRVIGHRGSWAGYRAASLRFPEEGVSLIGLCNYNDSDILERLFHWAELAFSDASQ